MIYSRYNTFVTISLLQHPCYHNTPLVTPKTTRSSSLRRIVNLLHGPLSSRLRDNLNSSVYTISSPCFYHLKTESSARVVILRCTDIRYSGSASASPIFSRHHNTRASSEKRTFANFFRLGTLFPCLGFSFQHAEYSTMKRELAMFDRS